MTKSRFESNSEKAPAYPELEAARAKLEEVKAQAGKIEDRLREILEAKRSEAARAGDIMFQAEALLEGGAEALPPRDYDSELRALWTQQEILIKAAQIQQGRFDEAVRLASSEAYRKRKPAYIAAIKKMIAGVEAIEAALNGMQAIKTEMTASGLRDIIPVVVWPGLNPGNFQRQREAFEYSLQQQGLGEAITK
jgi:hypothetical protein